MSFRLKTILGIGFIEAFLLFILIMNSLNFLKRSTEDQLIIRAESIAQLFATTIKDAVLSSDLASLESFTKEVLNNTGVVYARVLEDGVVIAEKGNVAHLKSGFVQDTNLRNINDSIYDTKYIIKEADIEYGIVQIGVDTNLITSTLNEAKQRTFFIGFIELLLSALCSLFLGNYLTKKLKILETASDQISKGNYDVNIMITDNDEIGKLAKSFNEMSKNLKLSQAEITKANNELEETNSNLERIVQERTKDLENALKDLELAKNQQVQNAYKAGITENAVSILHNIGNSITPININIERLKSSNLINKISNQIDKIIIRWGSNHFSEFKECAQDDRKIEKFLTFLEGFKNSLLHDNTEKNKMYDNMELKLGHISNIIMSQQKYAKFQSAKEKFTFDEVITDILEMNKEMIRKCNIKINMNLHADKIVYHGDKNKFMQVLLNILTNSIESIKDELLHTPTLSPEISIAVSKCKSDRYNIVFQDTGRGAEQKVLDKAFKFGYSTKERGSGFGLHDCANFIKSLNGELKLLSEGIGKGAIVHLSFPASPTS